MTTVRCRYGCLLSATLATLAGGLAAQEAAGLTFHLPLDGTVQPSQALGDATPRVTGTIRFADGVFGQALVVGETGAALSFTAAGNLPLQRGTVELWLLPVAWNLVSDKGYEGHHIFFRAQDDRGWFQIYKFDQGGFYCVRGTMTDYEALAGLIPYRAVLGRWVHLVTTWDGNDTRQFVNGTPFTKNLKPLAGLPASFEVGDLEWAGTTPGGRKPQTTLLDDLRIYDRPLTPAEIQTRCAAGKAQVAARKTPLTNAPLLATAPALDGAIKPGEWDAATSLAGFRVQPGADPADAVGIAAGQRLRLGHDATNLYLAFQRPIDTGAVLISERRDAGGDPGQDDSVTVELAPRWNGAVPPTTIHRYTVNLSGSRTPDAGWSAACGTANQDRVSELVIPFATLGVEAPKAGERWAVRFLARRKAAGGSGDVAAWPGHAATAWGALVFRGDAAAVQVADLACDRLGKVRMVATSTLKTAHPFAEVPGSAIVDGRIADQGVPFLETGLIDRATGDELWYDRFATDLEKGAVLDLQLRPSLGVGHLEIAIRGAGIDPAARPVTIELVDEGRKRSAFARDLGPKDFTDGLARVDLPIKDLAPGSYLVRSMAWPAKATAATVKETRFVKPTMPWIGNTVGVLDDATVPDPWTPLALTLKDGRTELACIGRTMVLDRSPLPAALTGTAGAMLAEPVRLRGTRADGSTEDWRPTGLAIESNAPAKVVFSGTGRLGGATLTLRGTMEYDGLVWYDLAGDVAASGMERLDLQIPMPTVLAAYRLIGGGGIGAVVSNDGLFTAPWRSGLEHSLWIGNDRAGLTWYAESDRTWKSVPGTPRMELVRQGSVTTLQVNLVSGGVAGVKGPFSFGLQATPTKPLASGWRRQALNITNAWVFPKQTRYHGYPQHHDGELGAQQVDLLRAKADYWRRSGGLGMTYLHSSMLSTIAPEWSYFGLEWANPGSIYPYVPKGEADYPVVAGVCPAAPGWIDFNVHGIRDYLLRSDIDGLYHDFGPPSVCSNGLHGCDGGMPLRAYRELHKRLYVMLRQIGRDRGRPTWYVLHTSICANSVVPMQTSFVDSICDSETVGGDVARLGPDLFVRQLPLAYYRIRGSAQVFGVANHFIMNVEPVLPANFAMGLIHDIVSHHNSFSGTHRGFWLQQLVPALNAFGLGDDDVEFRGYWDGARGAAVTGGGQTPEDVLHSLYVKPGARALVVLVNRANKARTERLSIDAGSLGLPPDAPFTDLLTGALLPSGPDGCALDLPALGARYVVVGARPQTSLATATDQPIARWIFGPPTGVAVRSSLDQLTFASRLVGPTGFVEGIRPGEPALRLDGRGHLEQIPSSSELSIYNGDELTVALWLKPEVLSGRRGLAAFVQGLDNKLRFAIDQRDGRLGLVVRSADGTWSSSETEPVLAAGRWQHLVCVLKEGGRFITLWLDGRQVGSLAAPAGAMNVPLPEFWAPGLPAFVVGKTVWSGDPQKAAPSTEQDGFRGDISDVKVWLRAMDQQDLEGRR